MNFDQVLFFLAVERHCNFTVAAEDCYVSQSSISKQIKHLEEELGVALFERDKRCVKLTEQGEMFSKFAHQVSSLYDQLKTDICRTSNQGPVTIKVSSIPVLEQYGIIPIFTEFKRKFPEIQFEITEHDPKFVLDDINKRSVDIAILRNSGHLPKDLNLQNFFPDELIVMTSDKHPLANKTEVELADFAGEVILLGRVTELNEIVYDEFEKAGFRPEVIEMNIRFRSIIEMVANNEGISLGMSRMSTHQMNPRLKIHYLKNHPVYFLTIVAKQSACASII